MSDNENKKGLFSINIVKKTESASPEKVVERQESEIGVEADIPIEDEGVDESLSISNNLKLNTEAEHIKEESENPAKSEILEKKVQVFNISSGKVIEKDLTSEETRGEDGILNRGEDRRDKLVGTQSRANKDVYSAAKRPQGNMLSRKLIISIGVVVLFIILYLVLSKTICVEEVEKQEINPILNISK